MAVNSHQSPTHCHDIDQASQVPVVDVAAVERDDISQLAKQCTSDSLDSEHLKGLHDVVRVGTSEVHILIAEYGHERRSICVDDPFLNIAEALLILPLRLVLLPIVHLGNGRDPLDPQLLQHVLLQSLHKYIELLRAFLITKTFLNTLFLSTTPSAIILDTNADHTVGVVGLVTADYLHVTLAVLLLNEFLKVAHLNLLSLEHFFVKLKPEQPRRPFGTVVSSDLVVSLNQVFVRLDDRLCDDRVVVNFTNGNEVFQDKVLQPSHDVLFHLLSEPIVVSWLLHILPISVLLHIFEFILLLQKDCHSRSLGRLGNAHDLLQTGHSERHILGGHSSVVESIQGHLGGGLSNGLRSEDAGSLTRVDLGFVEPGLYLLQDPIKSGRAKTVLLHDPLAAQHTTN